MNFSLRPTKRQQLLLLLLSLGFGGAVCLYATPYMGMASFSYALLFIGLLYRHSKKTHVKFMISGIGLDLLLVLVLQFQRRAIQTAMAFELAPLQQAHVGASFAATLLYFPVLWLGWRLWKDNPAPFTRDTLRRWHIQLASLAFLLRTIGFILMFSLVERYRSMAH